jgi:hypothetical protein
MSGPGAQQWPAQVAGSLGYAPVSKRDDAKRPRNPFRQLAGTLAKPEAARRADQPAALPAEARPCQATGGFEQRNSEANVGYDAR